MVRRHLATGHGLSVDDYRARWNQREEDLFDRLSNHSPDHLAGDLVKDVDAAVGFINSRYCAEHEFSATAQKYQLIIKALSADGDSAAVRQARAEVQIDLLVTLISSGDYSLGLRPRGAMLARMCGRVRLSSDVSEIKLVFAVPPDRPTPNIAPSWNVAPTDPLPVDEQRQRHADRSAIVVTAWEIARQKGATIEERWENMSVRSAGLAGSSRRNGECLPVSSHSTVLDYYRPRVLDETARRRCQDCNGTVVRAWHLDHRAAGARCVRPRGLGSIRALFS